MGEVRQQDNELILLNMRDYTKPPIPDNSKPFVQIDWIFNIRMSRADTGSTKDNYRAALSIYKKFITTKQGIKPFFLAEEWDEFLLYRFKQYLEERQNENLNESEKLSSYTVIGHFSAFRQVVKEAIAYNLLKNKNIYPVTFSDAFSETDAHASYSDNELAQILEAVYKEMQFTNSVLVGYRPQGKNSGRDPRIRNALGALAGYGWKVEANLRWYFENIMNATPKRGY